jgi:RNAse (barnase) inhibitor barstar
MSPRTTYVIDGRNFDTLEGFYGEISRVLIPQADWGRNLDAFNDILRGGFGTPDDGFVLEWQHSEMSRNRLGYPETVRQLDRRLSNCHPENRRSILAELERARRGDGPTVFDWLVAIIHTHAEGGREADGNLELRLQ